MDDAHSRAGVKRTDSFRFHRHGGGDRPDHIAGETSQDCQQPGSRPGDHRKKPDTDEGNEQTGQKDGFSQAKLIREEGEGYGGYRTRGIEGSQSAIGAGSRPAAITQVERQIAHQALVAPGETHHCQGDKPDPPDVKYMRKCLPGGAPSRKIRCGRGRGFRDGQEPDNAGQYRDSPVEEHNVLPTAQQRR